MFHLISIVFIYIYVLISNLCCGCKSFWQKVGHFEFCSWILRVLKLHTSSSEVEKNRLDMPIISPLYADYFREMSWLFLGKSRIIFNKSQDYFSELDTSIRLGFTATVFRKKKKKKKRATTRKKNDIITSSKYQKKKAIFGGYPPETKWLVPGLSGVVVGLLWKLVFEFIYIPILRMST